MNTILICVCVLSFLTLIMLCILIINYRNKDIKCIDDRIGKIINLISLTSTIFTVFALIISIVGLVIQNKSPKLEIEIYTMHEEPWKVENDQQLCLAQDNDGHIDFNYGTFNMWHLHIKNKGNQYAENMKIRIHFEKFGFISQPDSFTLSDYIYGTGFFSAIEYTYDQVFQPGEVIEIPYIPFENAEVFDTCIGYETYDFYSYNELNYTNMNIEIYENNSLVFVKNYLIELVDNPLIEYTCFRERPHLTDEEDIDKAVRKFNEYYFNEKDYFSEADFSLYSMQLYPKEFIFSLEECKMVYEHYLRLIYVYNPHMASIYKKLAVFYGRLYYLELSKEIDGINIEQAIQNDIFMQ